MRRGDLQRVVERRYWRRGDAAVVVAAWRDSGESLAGFAARWGVHTERLSRWARVLGSAGDDAGRQADVCFLPVQVVEAGGSAAQARPQASRDGGRWLAEIAREGWTVRVEPGFEAGELARLLRVVAEVAPC
jgi:hypothetical protein